MRNKENYKDFILEVLQLGNNEKNKRDIIPLGEDDLVTIEMELNCLGRTEKSKLDLSEILKMRFGLGDNGIKMTLKAVGRKIGVTQEAVRGFQNRALLKLIRYRKRVFKKFLVSGMKERINELENYYEEHSARINVLENELVRKKEFNY